MKVQHRGDNAGVLLWRGSEVAACLLRRRRRQQVRFSRKTTRLIHRRGAVAWRLAGFTDFTARGCASPGRPRTVPAWRTPVAWRLARVATFTARADGRGEYRTTKEVEDLVRLRPSFARPPVMQRAVRRASAQPVGNYRAFLFPNEDGIGGNQ